MPRRATGKLSVEVLEVVFLGGWSVTGARRDESSWPPYCGRGAGGTEAGVAMTVRHAGTRPTFSDWR